MVMVMVSLGAKGTCWSLTIRIVAMIMRLIIVLKVIALFIMCIGVVCAIQFEYASIIHHMTYSITVFNSGFYFLILQDTEYESNRDRTHIHIFYCLIESYLLNADSINDLIGREKTVFLKLKIPNFCLIT